MTESSGNEGTKLINVYTVNDAATADMIKNLLIEQGIQCELGGEHQGGFTGTLEIEIIVREADAALAKRIITEHNLR